MMKPKIKTIFMDMGNTLLRFHEGPSDDQKEKLGLDQMAEYLSQFSKLAVSRRELEREFFIPWLSFVTPRRKENLVEYPMEGFLNPFLDKRDIVLTPSQKIEALAEAHPDYPVPTFMCQSECEDLIRKLLP